MNEKEIKALQEVIEYLQYDEHKHWQELNRPKKHIYQSLRILNEWLRYN
jgi:hypothetical protein